MLKHRILTALVLIPLVVYLILFSSNLIFSLVFALISILALDEWSKIHHFPTKNRIFFLLLNSMLLLSLYWFNEHRSVQWIMMLIGLFFWFYAFWQIRQYEKGNSEQINRLYLRQFNQYLYGMLLLVPAWFSLVLVKQQEWHLVNNLTLDGGQMIMLLMLLVWCADTGAYFFGRLWGNKKLSPRVSPGKTQMGMVGAFVLSSGLILICAYWQALNMLLVAQLLFMSWVIVFVSIVGDLYESMIKRRAGVKDSGHILPGHGGVLDRIDSLTAAAPIFYSMFLLGGL